MDEWWNSKKVFSSYSWGVEFRHNIINFTFFWKLCKIQTKVAMTKMTQMKLTRLCSDLMPDILAIMDPCWKIRNRSYVYFLSCSKMRCQVVMLLILSQWIYVLIFFHYLHDLYCFVLTVFLSKSIWIVGCFSYSAAIP